MSKWFQFSVKGGIVPLMGLLPALALANPRSDIDMPANKQLGSVFNDDGAHLFALAVRKLSPLLGHSQISPIIFFLFAVFHQFRKPLRYLLSPTSTIFGG